MIIQKYGAKFLGLALLFFCVTTSVATYRIFNDYSGRISIVADNGKGTIESQKYTDFSSGDAPINLRVSGSYSVSASHKIDMKDEIAKMQASRAQNSGNKNKTPIYKVMPKWNGWVVVFDGWV